MMLSLLLECLAETVFLLVKSEGTEVGQLLTGRAVELRTQEPGRGHKLLHVKGVDSLELE